MTSLKTCFKLTSEPNFEVARGSQEGFSIEAKYYCLMAAAIDLSITVRHHQMFGLILEFNFAASCFSTNL